MSRDAWAFGAECGCKLEIEWQGGHQAEQNADAYEPDNPDANEYLSHIGSSNPNAIGLVNTEGSEIFRWRARSLRVNNFLLRPKPAGLGKRVAWIGQ
jgi:hypothetical protein